jgi:hypothetical protein
VTSNCGADPSATATLTLPFTNTQFQSDTGFGSVPWTCTVNDNGVVNVASVDYWVFCDVDTE